MMNLDPASASEKLPPPSQGLKDRALAFYHRHERYAPAAFFIAGFLFDVFTLGRIDDLFTIAQQGIYLVLIGMLISLEVVDLYKPFQLHKWLMKLWSWREFLIHFLFGSLLSAYTLFYFKSASLVSSAAFMVLMAGLMVANEFERFQKLGPVLRFGLYSLCLVSYFGYVIPTILGFIGWLPLSLSIGVSCTILWAHYNWLQPKLMKTVASVDLPLTEGSVEAPQPPDFMKSHQSTQGYLRRTVLLTGFGVQIVFLFLYLAGLIPPVPLSIQYMGVYHKVEKIEGKYILSYDRPFWRIWESGAQTFIARPGDRIHVFARVFSPANFEDEIKVRWLYKDPVQGWIRSDAIPIRITGGREEGFRGFTFKQNFQPGSWRVRLETIDGREIGRIGLTVVADTNQGPREFSIDQH